MSKRVNVSDLVIGCRYVVSIKNSIWNTKEPLTYIGTPLSDKRKHYFSFGGLSDWDTNFGVCACKSQLIVFEP